MKQKNKISQQLSKFSKKEINNLFESAKSIHKNSNFIFLKSKNSLLENTNYGRICIISKKKSGNAPERNKFKRRAKNIFYNEKLYLNQINYILIAYREIKTITFQQLKTVLLNF